ncbi:GNAT family N-acetyltransferase [Pseudoduganella umbonata]|uniref:GNAT family N-acetyltransferase n=1 Tax=Pseudoduganella umbonata TaxID=864828 RepID=A0A4P8HS41_9BURK|nr:GNAT family N-acetyltransferase [Pseudoduganella umbonata]MBB3223941.1 RimJ/RimL family protein N-acetyltransferase [Pseudoduganella umbonata]QCP12653.1 GNAT family N-acetyltransferase [Pseudoduganella umbonata]
MNALLPPAALPVLCGERVTLRPMDEHDAAALFAIYGDPLVMRHTGEDPFPELATVGQMLASVRRLLASGQSLEWAIVLAGSGELVGTCGLHSFDAAARAAQVGCLLRRSAWGRGIMPEALAVLAAYAAEVLRLHGLMADVAPQNTRARRMFRRLGYREDGNDMLRIGLRPAPRA